MPPLPDYLNAPFRVNAFERIQDLCWILKKTDQMLAGERKIINRRRGRCILPPDS